MSNPPQGKKAPMLVELMVTVMVTVELDPTDDELFDADVSQRELEDIAIAQVNDIGRNRSQFFEDRENKVAVKIVDVFTEAEFERDWTYSPPPRFITVDGRSARNPLVR